MMFNRTTTRHRLRSAVLLLSLIFALSFLAGCASSSKSAYDAYNERPGDARPAENDATDDRDTDSQFSVEKPGTGGEAPQPGQARKIIRNGQIMIRVESVADTYDEILTFVRQHGGYESSRQQKNTNDHTQITAQLRIAPDKLDLLLDFIAGKGELLDRDTRSKDITEDYLDVDLRLKNMTNQLTQYETFLRKAADVEEALMVQKRIDELTNEIESLKGKQRLWNSQLDESTVELKIYQKLDPLALAGKEEWTALSGSEMLTLMRIRLVDTLGVALAGVQWLLIILVSTSPVWVLITLVVLLILWLRRRRLRRKAKKLAAAVAMPAQGMVQPPVPPAPHPPVSHGQGPQQSPPVNHGQGHGPQQPPPVQPQPPQQQP